MYPFFLSHLQTVIIQARTGFRISGANGRGAGGEGSGYLPGMRQAAVAAAGDVQLRKTRKNDTGYPLNALVNALISNFFILRNAAVTRSTFPGSLSVVITSRIVGTICQLRPYLSTSQPHCSASGTKDSLLQK